MSLIRPVDIREKQAFNAAIKHPLQTWEWGEFREKTGVKIERFGVFDQNKLVGGITVSFHPIPKTPYTIGYYPKGEMPDKPQLELLQSLAERKNAVAIKLEPNIATPVEGVSALDTVRRFLADHGAVPGRPLFTKHTLVLDLKPDEQLLLAKCKPKTRYNIGVAEKAGVQIIEDNSDETLEEYLQLQSQTTSRQGFYAHSDEYFRTMWQTLKPSGMIRMFKAMYDSKTLVVWILFQQNGVLYYPYGASSRENREVMASNLMMWEVIKAGKKSGCTSFDMWGSLGPNPDPSDPWFGFHRFKSGYGTELREFLGTYDLVSKPQLYSIYRFLEEWRWKLLRIKKQLGI